MNIIKKICGNWSERGNYKPDTIVIHISAGSLTSMTNWFSTPGSQASAHYGIGKDGTILQYVEEDKKAWSNGNIKNPSAKAVLSRPGINPNLYTLSIENEGQDLQYAPQVQIDTLCALIKDIAGRWNIPLDREHIIGHFEIDAVNRPYCPSPNHNIMDKTVGLLAEDTVAVPRKLLEELIKCLQ
jgi:N-acetyl-anhydromuramyl-L-alanine amidase AmpD